MSVALTTSTSSPDAPSPSSSLPSSEESVKRKIRKLTLIACEGCQSFKRKCDGGDPCGRCASKNIECVRNRTSRYTGNKRKGRVEEEVVPKPCDELVSKHMLSQLLDMNAMYGEIFTFSKELAEADSNALYKTTAKQVRVDAVLAFYARAYGLGELYHQLQQRGLKKSQEIMTDFSTESASSLFVLGLALFGSDLAKTRHLLRMSISLFKEANPGYENSGAVNFMSGINEDSLFYLIAVAASLFLTPESDSVYRQRDVQAWRRIPMSAWTVREAVKRHNISDNLGPFDLAQLMGVDESELLQQRQQHQMTEQQIRNVQQLMSAVNMFLKRFSAAGNTLGKSLQRMHILCLIRKSMLHFILREFAMCKQVGMHVLSLMDAYPASFLSPNLVPNLGHLFDMSIQMRDLGFFTRCQTVCSAMKCIASAAALSKAMEDIPRIYAFRQTEDEVRKASASASAPLVAPSPLMSSIVATPAGMAAAAAAAMLASKNLMVPQTAQQQLQQQLFLQQLQNPAAALLLANAVNNNSASTNTTNNTNMNIPNVNININPMLLVNGNNLISNNNINIGNNLNLLAGFANNNNNNNNNGFNAFAGLGGLNGNIPFQLQQQLQQLQQLQQQQQQQQQQHLQQQAILSKLAGYQNALNQNGMMLASSASSSSSSSSSTPFPQQYTQTQPNT